MNIKGVKLMAKNKKNQSDHKNNALPKDTEFADDRENGLERVALKAQRDNTK
ncbi:hypothetical protein HMPREF1013_04644 [Bacillus sp. 2_A_57_CT2]|nr:hypothetical protein HMPREF1013_04644 [Bacillus sp. 2_A_57_CT2]